jgi:hypothetical protein
MSIPDLRISPVDVIDVTPSFHASILLPSYAGEETPKDSLLRFSRAWQSYLNRLFAIIPLSLWFNNDNETMTYL